MDGESADIYSYLLKNDMRKRHREFPQINAGIPAQLTNRFPIRTLPPLGEGLKPVCTPERVVHCKHTKLTN